MNSTATSATASSGWWRETIDSFAMALILAFMFRAFVAEAFVIPTGSMAPTLMGAHKDVTCSQCGWEYQCGASSEFDSRTGQLSSVTVIGTTCPLCRYEQPVDLSGDANHATFSGDRILVSKLAYALGDPQRWDVIVFKYPQEARQNYIKRLVGLPNETLRIRHGDIFVKPEGAVEFTIARKPPNVVETLLQPVADTNYRAAALVKAGLPSRWQPAGPIVTLGSSAAAQESDASWRITNTADQWAAEHPAVSGGNSGQLDWLRYYHYIVSPYQWEQVIENGKLPTPVPPRSSRLISDFAHYNAETNASRRAVYTGEYLNSLRGDYAAEHRSYGLGLRNNERTHRDFLVNDGAHWVGDLAAELDLQWSGSGVFAIDLVEAGVHYTATIDPAAGQVTIQAIQDGQPLSVFEGDGGQTVDTIRAAIDIPTAGAASIRFANVDDTLHLWVDGELAEMLPSNRIALSDAEEDIEAHRPRYSPQDPADAAPVGLGISPGMTCTVSRATVSRDVYYTAFGKQTQGGLLDYPNIFSSLQRSVTEQAIEHYIEAQLGGKLPSEWSRRYEQNSTLLRDVVFSEPSLWEDASLFRERQPIEFTLGDGQYFPMGDNSTASADARSWVPEHFVHRDLMIGRAVLVFWPHPWNRPIPYLPNFERFGIIR